jgi:hypothetical protein
VTGAVAGPFLEYMMKRILLAGLTLAASLGLAAAANAQLYPPFPGSYQSLYDLYPTLPTLPFGLSGTARHDVSADSDCGAANPQGGIPSAVTWGYCP